MISYLLTPEAAADSSTVHPCSGATGASAVTKWISCLSVNNLACRDPGITVWRPQSKQLFSRDSSDIGYNVSTEPLTNCWC